MGIAYELMGSPVEDEVKRKRGEKKRTVLFSASFFLVLPVGVCSQAAGVKVSRNYYQSMVKVV